MPDLSADGLLNIIETDLAWPVDRAAVNSTTKIGPDGIGLDSIMLIEMAISLEEAFGVTVPDEDVALFAEWSVGELLDHVRALPSTDADPVSDVSFNRTNLHEE